MLRRVRQFAHLPSVDSDAVRLEVNENVRERVADGPMQKIQDGVVEEVRKSVRTGENPD